jgi:hypothetical protein
VKLSRRKFARGVFNLQHGRTPADALSYMWSCHLPERSPTYGPHRVYRTIDEKEWKAAISHLVEMMRELCIYNIKHVDIARVRHRVDELDDRLQQLARHFYFQDIKLVCQFLKRYSFLIPVLFEVRKKVDQYFGTETLSNLELFTDPEDDGGNSKLFALILTALPSSDASARLDRMDQEWWLEQPYEVRRAMNLDINYSDGSV